MNRLKIFLLVAFCMSIISGCADSKAPGTKEASQEKIAFVVSSKDEKNYQEAYELYSQLKKWEIHQNWDKFFQNKDSYVQQIESSLKSIDKDRVVILKAKYLDWQIKVLSNNKKSQEVFDNLIAYLSTIKIPTDAELSFLNSVINSLEHASLSKFKSDLASAYKELLKKTEAKGLVKKEADNFYEQGDVDSAVSLYKTYIDSIQDKAKKHEELLDLVYKFSDTGVNDKADAEFAVEITQILEQDYSRYPKQEGLFYVLAYNYEKLKNLRKALFYYVKLLSEFPETALSDEVNFRIAHLKINLEKDFEGAKAALSKIKNKNLFSETQLLDVLKKKYSKDEYNLKRFSDVIVGNSGLLGSNNFVDLRTEPSKIAVDDDLRVAAISFSPDTGCLVAQGLYLWSGDFGELKISTNMPSFTTKFSKPGLKVLNVVEEASEGIIGYGSILVDVYAVKILPEENNFNKNEEVKFTYDIEPALPKDLVTVNWSIKGDDAVSDAKVFPFVFLENKEYIVTLTLYYLNNKIATLEKDILVR